MIRRALAVWLILIGLETVHGIVRRIALEPWIGDFPARQIGVMTGSLLIVATTYLFIGWIRAKTSVQLWTVGALWVLLTLAFEIGAGRILFNASWERIGSDFNLAKGGLLGIGMAILASAPWIASWLRGKSRRPVP